MKETLSSGAIWEGYLINTEGEFRSTCGGELINRDSALGRVKKLVANLFISRLQSAQRFVPASCRVRVLKGLNSAKSPNHIDPSQRAPLSFQTKFDHTIE
jgi:hypothetical protein